MHLGLSNSRDTSGELFFDRIWFSCLLGWDHIRAPAGRVEGAAGGSRHLVLSQEARRPNRSKNKSPELPPTFAKAQMQLIHITLLGSRTAAAKCRPLAIRRLRRVRNGASLENVCIMTLVVWATCQEVLWILFSRSGGRRSSIPGAETPPSLPKSRGTRRGACLWEGRGCFDP